LTQELPLLKQGIFYFIRDSPADIIMEDKTKRGLTVQERSLDENYNVEAEKGMIYDMDGIGHRVGIRWYFPKQDYDLKKVLEFAEAMEAKYKKLREETCPDY
jgi:hypothetical protein